MANTIESLNLVLLNNGQPTRITLDSETAFDLSICSPTLTPQLTWDVLPSSHSSDHNTIIINLISNQPINPPPNDLRFNYKKARWEEYSTHVAWHDVNDTPDDIPEYDTVRRLYDKF